jgi:RNA polymerase sigma-54 factor
MPMRQRVELKQTQSLTMTPQLRQSIAMLRMTAPELEAFLAAEIEKNPLLAFESGGDDESHGPPGDAPPPAARGQRLGTGRADGGYRPRAPQPVGSAAPVNGAPDPLAGVHAPVTLADHVRAQLPLAGLDPLARAVADLLCADLDEDGYLRLDVEAAADRLGAPCDALERAADAIRGCDPAGVGARDLAECLRLQLADQDALDVGMAAILDRLDLLPRLPAREFAARCGLTETELADRLGALRGLDPRPGRRFAASDAAPAAPDAIVEADGAGGWRVALNPEATPRLLVDQDYAATVGAAGGAEARRFLGACARDAAWLRQSLDQRARTILAVAAAIVARQERFLTEGVKGLAPLTQREIAEALSLHESTISRATAHKTLATPRGVVDLRLFFSAALDAGDGGEAHAAEAVRARIRKMVEGEAPTRPLSDEALVKALSAEGIAVARRTVAKYRESLGIASSFERRRRAAAAVRLC